KPVEPNGRRAKLEAKIRTARLADAYMQAKRQNLAMDFSDQVRFAQRIIDEVPAAAQAERARWRIVLLDEFQDTSVAQLRLLRDLFASTTVTAVSDHRQAIYGWRGASADHMRCFSSDFTEGESLTLSTSRCNDRSILHMDNRIAEGLTDSSESPLSACDGAGDGQLGIEISSGAHDPVFLTIG